MVQNLSFGRPGASSLAPWGTMGRSRGTWEDTEDTLGVQTLIFTDFEQISGPHFGISFSGTLGQNSCLFSCLFPGLFFFRFRGQNLLKRGCKNQLFTEVGILPIVGSILEAWGIILAFLGDHC